MATVTSGINVNAQTHSYFEGTPTYGSTPVYGLDVKVGVNDAEVRKQFDYDGLERPFVMIPTKVDGQVQWQTQDLVHTGTSRTGYFGDQPVDDYALPKNVKVDLDAVRQYGIAIGMHTNNGDVWAQQSGQNFKVTEQP